MIDCLLQLLHKETIINISTPMTRSPNSIGAGNWSPNRVVGETPWRHDKLRGGGGPVLDLGVHHFNMARYWLDIARYGDTHGLHLDNYREMWPYRDWVIASFNNDKPYNQFVREQIAGDELPDASTETVIATGFCRLGPWDDEPADPADEPADPVDEQADPVPEG